MDIQSKNLKTQFLAITSILLLALMITQSTLNAREEVIPTEEKITAINENEINDIQIEKKSIIESIIKNSPIEQLTSLIDTIPSKKLKKKSKSKTTIISNDGNESVTVEIENGEVKRIEVDGKEIPAEDYDKYTEENLDMSSFDNLGDMKMYLLQEGDEDFDFHFDFPKDLGNSFRFEHGDGHPQIIHLDSLMNLYNDSVFAFSFGEDFPNRFEHEIEEYNNVFEEYLNTNELFEELREKGLLMEGEGENLRLFGIGDGNEFEWHHGPEHSEEDQLRFFLDGENNRLRGNTTLEDLMGQQLNKDGFLLPNKENKVLLTGKCLKINGEKQPSNIWNKYKTIFENETGVPLSRKSRLEFSIIGKEYGKRYKAF